MNPEFLLFLQTTYIYLPNKLKCTETTKIKTLDEVVDEVIQILVPQNSNNVLTFGMSQLGQSGEVSNVHGDVQYLFINTIINIIKGEHFYSLHQIIGDEALKFLLLNSIILMKVNTSYLQVFIYISK